MPDTPLVEWLATRAEERPDHLAIAFGDHHRITYRELAANVHRAAESLVELGVGRGDRVAWMSLNSPAGLELLLACARVGAIFMPLNNRQTPEEHRFQLDHAGVSLVVGQRRYHDHLLAAGDRQVVHVESSFSELPEAADRSAVSDLPGSPRPAEHDPVLLVYTSGTTGRPKGALHTHATQWATIQRGVRCQDITSDDVAIAPLPLFHVGGLNIQTLPVLVAGGTVVLHEAFDAERFLDDVEQFSPTLSIMVPAVIAAVTGHPRWRHTDLTSFRGVTTGSSVVPARLLQALNDAGVPAGQVYGATETGPTSVALSYEDAHRVGSAGRAVQGTETRLGEADELLIRGDNVFVGYWDDPAATDAAFVDGWYRTGDVATIDGDGYHVIIDRVRDVIISGGENVYAAEVEAVLADAPGVGDIAVVARPDERWGEVPVAFVVPTDGANPTSESLREHGARSLARYKLPKEVHLVESFPLTALGKVRKFDLRRQLTDGDRRG